MQYKREADPLVQGNRRKKICMVTHSLYESDNRVRRYAEALVKRGDQVEVIAITLKDRPLGESVINGVIVHDVQRRLGDEGGKWAYATQLIRFLLTASRLLKKRHKAVHFDLIHVHNIPDFMVFSAWYPKLAGARVILDIHDIVPELFVSKFPGAKTGYVWALKKIEWAATAFADHVIVANHLWQDTLNSRSVRKEKTSVFLNHVDPSLFYRRTRTRHDGKIVMMFPGTFGWHQGLDIAVRALTKVKDKLPGAELHLYGGGTGKGPIQDLARLAEQLNLKDSVNFHKGVALDHIAQEIANADVGVVPKRADSFGNEAYSTKIMEFMSQGVPVVVSRTKIDSYYFDERNVRFFDSGDSDAMAKAVVEVIQNKTLRDSLIEEGLRYAERHSWDHKKYEYFALIDSMTAQVVA